LVRVSNQPAPGNESLPDGKEGWERKATKNRHDHRVGDHNRSGNCKCGAVLTRTLPMVPRF